MASQIALFGYDFKAAAQIAGLRNVKQSSVLTFPFLFFDNANGYVKKFDMALRLGLLPCNVNPFGTVFFRDDIVFCQVCQISPADAREPVSYTHLTSNYRKSHRFSRHRLS